MADVINTHKENPEQVAAQQAHDQEMLEKGEALDQTPESARPDWLPSKFQTPEDMANAYKELETKMGQNDETQEQDDDSEYEEVDIDSVTMNDAAEFLDEQGFDYDAFAQEYAENGELSAEAYEALEEAGLSRELVEAYISGQEAVMADMQEQAWTAAGGQQEYSRMIEWAANNLSEGEIDAYNQSLDTTDMNQALFAIQGLAARYRGDVGTQPNLVSGQTAGSSAGSYQSVAELTRDMQDPRYDADPAFRQSVAMKLQHSSIL